MRARVRVRPGARACARGWSGACGPEPCARGRVAPGPVVWDLTPCSSPRHSLLLNLTEVLFHRIYSFIPEFVAPHTAVCKAFKRYLPCSLHALHAPRHAGPHARVWCCACASPRDSCVVLRRELMKMQFVHLRIRSCPNTDLQVRCLCTVLQAVGAPVRVRSLMCTHVNSVTRTQIQRTHANSRTHARTHARARTHAHRRGQCASSGGMCR